jgi:hypothetical protein
MALQLCLRRSSGLFGVTTSATNLLQRSTSAAFQNGAAASFLTPTKRWASAGVDLGDVIGIDLGTTNSCVCVMVRRV